jgi:hypothetical protein
MADFKWDDLPDQEFDWDSQEDVEPAEGMGKAESALLGAQQSAMFGFGDELAGRVAQGVDFAQGLFGESPTEMAAKAKADGIDIGNMPSTREELYKQARNESRQEFADAQAANPMSYGAGGLAGGMLLPGLGASAGLGKIAAMGAAQGAAYGAGASEEEDAKKVALDSLIGAGIGGAGGAVAKLGGDFIANKAIPAAGKAIGKLGDSLRGSAEKFAVKATGATGKQAGNFADDAGRELLDRDLVRIFDTPEDIAGRVGGAVDDAGAGIERILQGLDDNGVEASVMQVTAGIRDKIDELSQTPGNEKIIRQLQGELDSLMERGQSRLPIGQAEVAKRNYQAQTNYASPEAEKKASAILARAFKDETEAAATAANPAAGKAFQEEKRLFGLLKPVQEAAEQRASTLSQSPFGGLGDAAASAAGASAVGPVGLVGAVGRRLVAPRLSSMMAVSTDAIANVARSAPQKLGKFSQVIQNASQRGPQAVAATHFMLQQSNQEYRERLKQIEEEDDEGGKFDDFRPGTVRRPGDDV